MPSPFDALQALTFDTAAAVLGYEATWTPFSGAPAKTGRVLFKNPADDQRLAGVDYHQAEPMCEYREGVFAGLKELVDARSRETLTVNGIAYYVRTVEGIHDGRTFCAVLVKK